MAGRLPDGAMHQDRGVEADDIFARGDVVMPPGVLDISQKLHAERAVVPGAVEAAVDFGSWIDEPAALAEGNEFFHYGCFGHGNSPEYLSLTKKSAFGPDIDTAESAKTHLPLVA